MPPAQLRHPGGQVVDRWWLALTLGALAGTAEWVRQPGPALAGGVTSLALLAGAVLFRNQAGWRPRLLGLLLLVLGVAIPIQQWGLTRLATRWPEAREARIDAASRRLEGDLRADLRRIGELAGRVMTIAPLGDEQLFHRLPGLIPGAGVETGVALFRPDGSLRAWAGRHRLPPEPEGDSLAVRSSPYFHVFETRRTLEDGSVVVANLLLDADRAIPGRERSLSERFRQRTEVGLEIFAADAAPDGGDIFDYEEPTTAGPRVLFSVRPVPPSQGQATERAVAAAGRLAILLALGVLVAATLVAQSVTSRYVLLGALFWLIYRTPALVVLGLDLLSAPALFYRELPFGVGLVAGPLLVAGFILTVIGVRIWRSEPEPGVVAQAAGVLLLLAAPFLVRTLGQGITPPVEGVSIPLWLTWEVTLLLATAGLVVPAVGILRGRGGSPERAWPPLAGAALASAAAVLGLFAWEGRSGWPDWYTLLWLPALILVSRRATRWATILGIAVVAGSAAALMTWGAELEGRVELARRDLLHLGGEPELLAEPILQGFAAEMAGAPVPHGDAALLAAWRRSGLDGQGYPVRLELRAGDGRLLAVMPLDQLDLPDSLVAGRVMALPAGRSDTIHVLARTPGLHYLLVQRLAPDSILVVGVGPRSRLVPSARMGRLTRPPVFRRAAYTVNLTPGAPVRGTEASLVRWRRENWTILGERTVDLPEGPRQAFAAVEMLRPGPLLIRGALVLLLNVALLGFLWRVAEWLAGAPLRLPEWSTWRRSFRAQLFVALGAFFVVPVAIFAGWSVLRLNEDATRSGQLAVTQVLRDALAAEPNPTADDSTSAGRLAEVSERVDAELGIYRGGFLVAGTAEALGVFGLLGPVMSPDAYHHLRLVGQRDAFEPRLAAGQAGLVGYRIFRVPGLERSAVLATPQSAGDPLRAEQQLDLLLALLLALLLGVLAALVGARLAARRLSRPVSDLRRAALAFGEGRGLQIPATIPPAEFEPVFAAFQKMADDVQANQESQERAARVLAWGEMARQVAHEIKNPLTPMRLGIQHLQRVWRERADGFGPALEETAPRVLGEIDRLDRIARSFSRFGAPAAPSGGLDPVDLALELGEVVRLYRFGETTMSVDFVARDPVPVLARPDEVKEVLLNLLENARHAGARRVALALEGRVLTIGDDGPGMVAEKLERIFEPRFSTTTSGAGLGLAIVRRLVEGWGGTITVESEVGKGTQFTIRFTE
jgi:signal transduction histidine kinase